MSDPKTPIIVKAEALNNRSIRVDFDNGEIRLFDAFRLRGPGYVPIIHPDVFGTVYVEDGELHWEGFDATVSSSYVHKFSVPYDPNAKAKEYIKTRRDIIGERIAIILFPIMAIAGIIGTVFWYINH